MIRWDSKKQERRKQTHWIMPDVENLKKRQSVYVKNNTKKKLQMNVDAYFMEYDSDRAGGFEPLRMVPKDKMVVLGLVTSKSGRLESKDEIKRRIDQASKFIDIEQLCLSPQCGFASTEEGNTLTENEQWAKLRTLVELAAEVWE